METQTIYQHIQNRGYTLYNTYIPGHKEFYISLDHTHRYKKSIILRPEEEEFITFENIPNDFGFKIKHHSLTIENLNEVIKQKQKELMDEFSLSLL